MDVIQVLKFFKITSVFLFLKCYFNVYKLKQHIPLWVIV